MKKITTIALLIFASVACGQANLDPNSSHYKAALSLYELTQPKELMKSSMLSMMQPMLASMAQQGRSQTQIAGARTAFEEFATSVANDPDMEKEMVKIYADSYTEGELDQMLQFYRSPVGQKSLKLMPELTQKGMAIGQRVAAKYQFDLQKKMESIFSQP